MKESKSKFGLRDMSKAWQDKGVLDRVIPIVPTYAIVPEKTALLVLDMNYVCSHRDYGIGTKFPTIGLRSDYFYDRIDSTVIPSIQRLLGFFREHRLPVIYTNMGTNTGNLNDLPETWRRIYPRIGYDKSRPGSKEFQIRDEVKPLPNEPVLLKRTSGAFASTNLAELLGKMGVDTIILSGVESDCCVYNTAVESNDRGYKCIVVDDATTTLTRTGHKLFLHAYGSIFFFNVRATEQVITEMTGALSAKAAAPIIAEAR